MDGEAVGSPLHLTAGALLIEDLYSEPFMD